jgi:hypothetical protein
VTWNGAGGWVIVAQARQENFLAHGLNDLPLARDALQRLGDGFAQLAQFVRATARAGGRSRHHDALARQMVGKGLARRPLAGQRRRSADLGRRQQRRHLVLDGGGFQFFQLKLQLVEQPGLAFGALPEQLPAQLRDLQLQLRDHRRGVRRERHHPGGFGFRPRRLGLCGVRPRLSGGQGGLKSSDVGRGGAVHGRHFTANQLGNGSFPALQTPLDSSCRSQPAASGAQLFRGWRQSIPSRR